MNRVGVTQLLYSMQLEMARIKNVVPITNLSIYLQRAPPDVQLLFLTNESPDKKPKFAVPSQIPVTGHLNQKIIGYQAQSVIRCVLLRMSWLRWLDM